jgi:Putative addiction module component
MLPERDDSGAIYEDDLSEIWLREIARRLQQIDSREVELLPWEEAERRLWSKVRF